jgi:DNA-binding response OmpR family regulator
MTGPVLIIEDDPDIAEVLRYSLEKATFETRVALDGEVGLKACLDRTNPPSLILLDLFLPLMSGAEICRRLRLDPTTSQTPIVVITAKAFELDRNLQIDADDYIVKPFSVRDVVQKVRTLLEQSHTHES